MGFSRRGIFTVPTLPATLTAFPVPVSITDNDFKQAGSGGYVGDSLARDVRFFSNSGLTTPLPFVKKHYDAAAGQFVGWVKPGSLASGQLIYAGIGDPALNADISDVSNTFNTGFNNVVIFFDAGGGALGAKDLITNVTGTVTGATLATGINGPAASFNGSGQRIDFGTGNYVTTGQLLVTVIVKPNTTNRCDVVSVWSLGVAPASQYDLVWGITSGKPDLYFVGPGGIKHSGAGGSGISTGTWYSMHGQADGTHVRCFLNGALQASDAGGAPGEGPQTSPTDAFRIGENNNGDGDTDAIVDTVYVHNTARLISADYESWLQVEDAALRDPASFLSYSSEPFVAGGAAAVRHYSKFVGGL